MDARIQIALRIIEEKKASIHLDLSETSKVLHLSEPHMLRLFHREVGKSFRRYLRDLRMAKAAELVRTQVPTKDVACACGYTDTRNFYRDFKSVYAMTPREMWLKQLMKSNVSSSLGQAA
jgi:AraC-like DNA-binding protein